jgi:hypothetical protein
MEMTLPDLGSISSLGDKSTIPSISYNPYRNIGNTFGENAQQAGCFLTEVDYAVLCKWPAVIDSHNHFFVIIQIRHFEHGIERIAPMGGQQFTAFVYFPE